jgi:alpha-glucosidase
MAIPQQCNMGLSGLSFVGTDIGGFGSDCTPELMARWIQVGVFSPLCRNHSAAGTKPQEPWRFSDEIIDIYRKYVNLRYELLPYFYDTMRQTEEIGLPMIRPLVLHYPKDKNVWNLNDEFLLGENLLVAPVVEQGATKRMVYLPEGTWYDYWTKEKIEGGQYFIKEAPLDVCPIFVKAGTVLPKYPKQMYVGEIADKDLVLTLEVYPGEGKYVHYHDNGEDFAYRNGEYNEYLFENKGDGNVDVTMLNRAYTDYADIKFVVIK